MTKNTKGIILAVSAALAVSNVYIFSKAALNEVHLVKFGLYWFGLGIIWNLIFILALKKHRKIKQLNKSSWSALGIIALLEMVGTIFFFLAIKTVENPAVVSFLANINPFIITALGFFLLKERFNTIEGFGMAITLIGAIIISFNGSEMGELFINGTHYVIMSGIIFGFSNLIAKKNINKLDPSFLAMSRIILLFFVSLIALFYFNLSFEIPKSALINISIGSILGPFLTATLGYLAIKYIEISKAAMVRSVRSLFVLVGSFLFFNNIPGIYQLIGGAFTILGVILVSLGKLKFNKQARVIVKEKRDQKKDI